MTQSHNEQKSAVPSVDTLKSAASVGFTVGSILYEKLTGDAYSEEEKRKLSELKRIYQECFQIDAPIAWNLDEKNRPTHRVKNHKWSLYVKQLMQSKQLIGQYHYQSNLIAEYASTYLASRSLRWVGSGRSGDLIEQFMGDWIHFALHDLLTLGSNDESVRKIKQRIKYLEEVQKHEALFQFGSVTRSKNKLDTIESIKQQLLSCLDVAAQESLRQCAREKFDSCRTDLSALLFSCTQFIYYARATDVYCEPIELSRFIDSNEKFLTVDARSLYPKLHQTHTGRMIKEIISLSGLEAFGSIGQSQIDFSKNIYFTHEFQQKIVDWNELNPDLPAWVESDSIPKCLKEFQSFGESILRVANLKKLIEEAYDLTGKVGDLWAYGDIQGKLSLKALLFLLEKEIDLLKNRFDKIHLYHNNQRQAYNLKYRINPQKGYNPNFNKVDDQKYNIDNLFSSIKNASQSIQTQMKNIPENLGKKIDTKKREFYKAVTKYLKQFHPSVYSQYQLLDSHILNGIHYEASSHIGENINIRLSWPLKIAFQNYQYLDKAEFNYFARTENNLTRESLNWKLGNSYYDWATLFFVHNKELFVRFQEKAKNFEDKVKKSEELDMVKSARQQFNHEITLLTDKIQNERPPWRFKLSLWPIRTAGWPFNRKANQFAELLLKEIRCSKVNIETAFEIAKTRIEATKARPTFQVIPEQIEVEQKFENPRKATNEWFEHCKTSLTNLEKNKTKFIIFFKKDDPKMILSFLLQYKDCLSVEMKEEFINSWENFNYLLDLELTLSNQVLDQVSKQQITMFKKLFEVVKTDALSNERNIAVNNLSVESEMFFKNTEISTSMEGYFKHGFLANAQRKDEKVMNGNITKPSLSA